LIRRNYLAVLSSQRICKSAWPSAWRSAAFVWSARQASLTIVWHACTEPLGLPQTAVAFDAPYSIASYLLM